MVKGAQRTIVSVDFCRSNSGMERYHKTNVSAWCEIRNPAMDQEVSDQQRGMSQTIKIQHGLGRILHGCRVVECIIGGGNSKAEAERMSFFMLMGLDFHGKGEDKQSSTCCILSMHIDKQMTLLGLATNRLHAYMYASSGSLLSISAYFAKPFWYFCEINLWQLSSCIERDYHSLKGGSTSAGSSCRTSQPHSFATAGAAQHAACNILRPIRPSSFLSISFPLARNANWCNKWLQGSFRWGRKAPPRACTLFWRYRSAVLSWKTFCRRQTYFGSIVKEFGKRHKNWAKWRTKSRRSLSLAADASIVVGWKGAPLEPAIFSAAFSQLLYEGFKCEYKY